MRLRLDEFLAGQSVTWTVRVDQPTGGDVDLADVTAEARLVPYEGLSEEIGMDPIYRDPEGQFVTLAGTWKSPVEAAGRYTIRVVTSEPLPYSYEYEFFVKQAANLPAPSPLPPDTPGLSDLDLVALLEEGI